MATLMANKRRQKNRRLKEGQTSQLKLLACSLAVLSWHPYLLATPRLWCPTELNTQGEAVPGQEGFCSKSCGYCAGTDLTSRADEPRPCGYDCLLSADWYSVRSGDYEIFNRHGVAGAVLQTPL